MSRIAALALLCAISASAQAPFKQLLVNAKQGNVTSQIAVADAYYKGVETGQNYRKAADWYTAAAHNGSAYAYYMLGEEYYWDRLPETRGLLRIPVPNVERNMALARINMLFAANGNYGPACAWMGWYYEEGYRIGHSDIETSSSSSVYVPPPQPTGGGFAGGLASAIVNRNGSNDATIRSNSSTNVLGGPQYEEAALWYRRGADQGDVGSEYRLGRLYEQGLGVHKDLALAAKWYQAAVQQKNNDAKIKLEMLQEQIGQPKP